MFFHSYCTYMHSFITCKSTTKTIMYPHTFPNLSHILQEHISGSWGFPAQLTQQFNKDHRLMKTYLLHWIRNNFMALIQIWPRHLTASSLARASSFHQYGLSTGTFGRVRWNHVTLIYVSMNSWSVHSRGNCARDRPYLEWEKARQTHLQAG